MNAMILKYLLLGWVKISNIIMSILCVFLLQQSGGTYKTKEQIQKAPTDDHPCNLTRTSVNILTPISMHIVAISISMHVIAYLINHPPVSPGEDIIPCLEE